MTITKFIAEHRTERDLDDARFAKLERAPEEFSPRAIRCPICRAHVVVRRRRGLKDSLLRVLALADHVKTLHPKVVS